MKVIALTEAGHVSFTMFCHIMDVISYNATLQQSCFQSSQNDYQYLNGTDLDKLSDKYSWYGIMPSTSFIVSGCMEKGNYVNR